MSNDATRYVDVRDLLGGHERRVCPDCGIETWFKYLDRETWATDQWNCQTCGSCYEDTLEYPCPECNLRMTKDGDAFVCRNEACEHDETVVDTDQLLERIISGDYPEGSHKPGTIMGECPLCADEWSINGDPDGDLECRECGEFYAGQYSDAWWCYAIWRREPEKIRVNEP